MQTENLDVFKLSHQFTLDIYKITEYFPEAEKFGLTTQMRRSASSICMNLAEGAYRNSRKEYKRFISIARGSCGELRYQVLLSKDLNYIEKTICSEIFEKIERISMMLTKLFKSL